MAVVWEIHFSDGDIKQNEGAPQNQQMNASQSLLHLSDVDPYAAT